MVRTLGLCAALLASLSCHARRQPLRVQAAASVERAAPHGRAAHRSGATPSRATPPPHPPHGPPPPAARTPVVAPTPALASRSSTRSQPSRGRAAAKTATEPSSVPKESAAYTAPVPEGPVGNDEPATRMANLSPSDCRDELETRDLPVSFLREEQNGVATAVRITGPMHGVRFVGHSAPSPHGIVDCRLALALEEMARRLSDFGVASVRMDNTYREGARIRSTGKRSQHSYALAADISRVTLDDGTKLTAEDHWGAAVGETPCGPEAVPPPSEDAVLLRDIVCALARDGVFHHLLTPSFNAAHRSHFHFDIQRDARWRMIR